MSSTASRQANPIPLSAQEKLNSALKTCAEEKIHTPHSIQPYGVMLVVNVNTLKIVGYSDNVTDFFNVESSALDGHLGQLLGEENAVKLSTVLERTPLQPIQTMLFKINGQLYDVNAHKSGDYILIEIEESGADFTATEDYTYNTLRSFSVDLRTAHSLKDLYAYVVNHIQQVTGYDRVMLYQFDNDWNGEVVAENYCSEKLDSYLGLKYPASDIPPQARALYEKSYIRIISDVHYKPAEIVSNATDNLADIDMTYATLRSVSPIHLQYLKNMGVSATMTISIIQNGKLWGLIACHHVDEKYVPYRLRMLCELMGHTFSALLSSFSELVNQKHLESRQVLIAKLENSIHEDGDLSEIFNQKIELTLNALNADGVVMLVDGNKTQFAVNGFELPTASELVKLTRFLNKRNNTSVFRSNDLEKDLSLQDISLHLKGGLLAVPISASSENYIMWFRQPEVNIIKWAGTSQPEIEEQDGIYRLLPRNSFKSWQEMSENRSIEWSNQDVELGIRVAKVILEHEKNVAHVANLAKTAFLTDMSHELRTPMNAIVGIANILDRDNSLSDQQKGLIKTLNVSSVNLLDLINDLLDLAKIEENKMELIEGNFNLRKLLEEVRSVMNVKASEKNIALNVKYPQEIDAIYVGDRKKIRQVILNLTSNAIRFTEEGFVQILAKFDNNDPEKLMFSVRDTGIGMSAPQLEKIFDKFTQAELDTSQRYGGTGLGLAISKSFVELMDGTLEVESQEGLGSKFHFTIPLKLEKKHQTVKPAINKEDSLQVQSIEKRTEPGTRKKILLAEDYQGNIIVAIHFLQDIGYEPFVVNNGQEAVDRMKTEKFDAVLMDVEMPVMNGFEATKIIRELQEQGELYKCPIIGMTAHAFIGDRNRCIEMGMDDYISKPFSSEDLKSTLGKYTK